MSAQDTHYAQAIDDTPPAGTARIGAEMRQVRERVGWKLAEVAAELRIKEPFLDAIEHGDLEALPGPAYQVGFVRSYAQALGLDGDEILRRFRAEGLGAVKKPELAFLAPVPDRGVPSGALILLGVVLLLAGYGFWFLHTENNRNMAASVPPVPPQFAPLAAPAGPAKPAPVAQAQPPAKSAPAATAPATTAISTPAPAAASPAAAPAMPSVPEVLSSPGGTSAPAAPPITAAAQAPAPSQAAAALGSQPVTMPGESIRAIANSWVEVKDASGNVVFSRLMHAGQSWPVPDLPGLTMTTGNAGGTEIVANGTATPPLGADGAVLHHYILTPDAPQAPSPAQGSP